MSGSLLEIDSVGGREQLNALLSEFVIGEGNAVKIILLEAIDDHGLRSEATLMTIAGLQKQGLVKATFYTKLSALSSELKKRSPIVTVKITEPEKAPKLLGRPGRKMTLNWQHLFVINVVDQGEFSTNEISKLIGMDNAPIAALNGTSAVDWIIEDSMRAYRFESNMRVDGLVYRYSFKSKNEWRKFQIDKWEAEGRPFPKDWKPPVMPSKALWSGFTNL